MYKTGNTVPSNDMRDLADNAQTLDEIIHSANDIVQTRTGRHVQTAAGFERRLNAAIQSGPVTSVNGQRGEVHLDMPIFRLSKNQFGNIDNNFLVGFVKNYTFNIDVSLYREIHSGAEWDKRDSEEREILTAMGLNGTRWFQPSPVRVIRARWSGHSPSNSHRYFIWPNVTFIGTLSTVASYAKLISGEITGYWLEGINNQWGLCGGHVDSGVGSYIHSHPFVGSTSGEVLFIWPAVVAGYVPLDRNKPKWGFYPYIGDTKND